MKDTVVKVIIDADGEWCEKTCPYLNVIDGYIMDIHHCLLFHTPLLSNGKPYRSDICRKAETEPRKRYKDSFNNSEEN